MSRFFVKTPMMMLMANFSKEGGLSVSFFHPEVNNDDGDDDYYIIMTKLI